MLGLNNPKLVSILRGGGVVILPTDTIYGLAACADNRSAVARLYNLKHREQKPGPVIAASIDQLVALGIDRDLLNKVVAYWPNPISIVMPSPDSLHYLHLGVGSLAVRIPKDAVLRKLLEHTGPLLTSSANHAGMPSAVTMQQARSYFGDQVDLYVEGGDLSGRQPSTVATVLDGRFTVLRSGAIEIDQDGNIVLDRSPAV